MLAAVDLKNGTTFVHQGKPFKVEKYTHTKIGRGGATIRVNVRNLETGNVKEFTFGSTDKFDELSTQKKNMQFLYADDTSAMFMDNQTFEQVELPLHLVKEQLPFLKEGGNVDVLFANDAPVSVDIPPKVKLKIAQTAPGVKGNSASNMYKSATLENGMSVRVPLFIKSGELVVVDTRTGEYVERAK